MVRKHLKKALKEAKCFKRFLWIFWVSAETNLHVRLPLFHKDQVTALVSSGTFVEGWDYPTTDEGVRKLTRGLLLKHSASSTCNGSA